MERDLVFAARVYHCPYKLGMGGGLCEKVWRKEEDINVAVPQFVAFLIIDVSKKGKHTKHDISL